MPSNSLSPIWTESSGQSKKDWCTGALNPLISLQKGTRSEWNGFISVSHDFVAPPVNSLDSVGTRSSVVELPVKQCVQSESTLPWHPSSGLDEVTHQRFHDNCCRKLLPWSSKECWDLESVGKEFLFRYYAAVLDDNACGFTTVCFSLGGDCVLLVRHWLSDDDQGVLDDNTGVTKDEVNCTRDDTVAVKLSMCLCVQGVLVSVNPDIVKC